LKVIFYSNLNQGGRTSPDLALRTDPLKSGWGSKLNKRREEINMYLGIQELGYH